MSKEKRGFFERMLQTLSSEMVDKVVTSLDKKAKQYVTDFIHDVAKKVVTMVVGVVIALVGTLFLFVAFAKLLMEVFHSTWIGWGIGGLVTVGVGLAVYSLSRRKS
jgi:multidrug transporter EmrE-like cation transporter